MDAQDILKSLSNLEESLKNINSARQQVQDTVNAYENARTQLIKLTQEFTSISTDLNVIITTVKDNQETLSSTLSDQIGSVFRTFNEKIILLESATTTIQSTFETSCQESSKAFIGSIDSSANKLGTAVDAAIGKFNEKATLEIAGIATALKTFKDAADEMQTDFQSAISTATTTQKTNHETIASDFQKSIDQHLASFNELYKGLGDLLNDYKQLMSSIITNIENESNSIKSSITGVTNSIQTIKDENATQYDDIVNKLKSLREGNIKAADNLSSRFNNVDNIIAEIKTSVLALVPKIDTSTNLILSANQNRVVNLEAKLTRQIDELKVSNNGLKKIVTFCLVAIILSIILNIVILIR